MLCVWVYGCNPGRVSDGSRLARTKLSPSSAFLLSFSGTCFVLLFLSFCRFLLSFCFVLMLSLELQICRLLPQECKSKNDFYNSVCLKIDSA